MPSSPSARARVAALALAATTLGGVAVHELESAPAGRVAPPVRPSVALALSITGDYRHHLLDASCTRRCDSVLRAMRPVVTAALVAQYPFIDWSGSGGPARDTIEMRWENVSEFFPGSQLKFLLRERGVVLDSIAVEFEHDSTISDREESDWSVDALRKAWQGSLPNALRGSDLLPRIFGRVPLNAAVDFSAPGDVFVPAHKDTLKAGAPHPVFELGIRLNSTALNIDDTGSVLLNECSLAVRSRGYTCPMRAVSVGNRTFGPADVTELRRARALQWRATRLRSFRPRTSGVTLSALP